MIGVNIRHSHGDTLASKSQSFNGEIENASFCYLTVNSLDTTSLQTALPIDHIRLP